MYTNGLAQSRGKSEIGKNSLPGTMLPCVSASVPCCSRPRSGRPCWRGAIVCAARSAIWSCIRPSCSAWRRSSFSSVPRLNFGREPLRLARIQGWPPLPNTAGISSACGRCSSSPQQSRLSWDYALRDGKRDPRAESHVDIRVTIGGEMRCRLVVVSFPIP